jgi:hypothetical protein
MMKLPIQFNGVMRKLLTIIVLFGAYDEIDQGQFVNQ